MQIGVAEVKTASPGSTKWPACQGGRRQVQRRGAPGSGGSRERTSTMMARGSSRPGRGLLPGLPDLGRLIDGVGAQQDIDESHELAGGQDERPFVGMFGGLGILGLIEGGVFR